MTKNNERKYEVGLGDSAKLIPQNIEKNSIHAVVTDPPY